MDPRETLADKLAQEIRRVDGNHSMGAGALADALEPFVCEYAALQATQARDKWKEAVLNEVIDAHIYTKEHDTNPRKAIRDAISWNCQVALDPAISRDAQALVERGRKEALTPDVGRLREALEQIVKQGAALRQGGPDPMDLQDLSDALECAVAEAHAALEGERK